MTGFTDRDRKRPFDHYALVVENDGDIDNILVPQLRRKIAVHETVFMVVGAQTASAVREQLGSDANALLWAPTDRFYQRLGFAYSKLLIYVREQHSQQRVVHLVTEPALVTVPEMPVDRAAAYLSYESMANSVFVGYGCSITCIWHRRERTRRVIEDVRRTHPLEWTTRGTVYSPVFVPPDQYLAGQVQPTMTAAPANTDVDIVVRYLDEVAACRAAIARQAELCHFVPAAINQVVAATSEIVTNGLRHGRPPVRLRAWWHDETLIVHVDDHGRRPVPADAGYRPPATPGDSAGLWIARQLADVLLTHTSDGLTAVRMYFPYAITHRHLDVPYVA